MSWPLSRSGASESCSDGFGPRQFSFHSGTTGYNYDFHRGADLPASQGATIYAPMTGAVARVHYTFFGFETSEHLAQFIETDPGSSLVATTGSSVLNLSCSRVGVDTFPTVARLQPIQERISPQNDDWVVELKFNVAPSITGAIGIGIFNSARTEYVAIEYDGTTFTLRGLTIAAAFTAQGATYAVSGKVWMRLTYTKATNTFTWQHSADGSTWTTITTETGRTFTATSATMIPTLYWRSGDTNATPYSVDIKFFNWYDVDQTGGRFGNWVQIARPDCKAMCHHMESVIATQGSFVAAGQPIGRIGKTGVDSRSGRVINYHSHCEYVDNNRRDYDDGVSSKNIFDRLLFPRVDVTNNVTVVRATGNDPDGVDCHKLEITINRADQDLDFNSVTFTGNTTSRTVNLNTRVGLEPTDVDIPKYSGVYITAAAFDVNSAAMVLTFYFSKAVVGATFVSYSVADTQGTVLASG